MELFPIPGGPETIAALALMLGALAQVWPFLKMCFFFLPLMMTSFQSLSQEEKLSTISAFPTSSAGVFG